jgi:hypothetical protein
MLCEGGLVLNCVSLEQSSASPTLEKYSAFVIVLKKVKAVELSRQPELP